MIVDGHLDIAMALMAHPGRDFAARAPEGQALGLPDLEQGGFGVVLATIFAPEGYWEGLTASAAARRQLHTYEELLYRFENRLFRVESRGDLALCRAGGPIGVVHLMEGADPIETPDDVRAWVDQGVRFVGLAWNTGNRWAGGLKDQGGVTPEGRQLLGTMAEEGVVPDVSHLSPRSVRDVLDAADGLVVASHANAAAVHPHPRNLDDATLERIAEREGVVGVVLYDGFLAEADATLDDVVRHVEHIAEVAGIEHVGIGSDLDGGFGTDHTPAGVDSARDVAKIGDRLAARGWSAEDVERVMGANWLRVLEQALPE